jgi:hypothetical protein
MAASTARARIQKGKDLEDYVAGQIAEKGLDPRATRSHGSGSGNSEKADVWTSLMVLGQNAGIECKHTDTILIQEWWRQTKKLEKLGREPVLVFKQTNDQYADTRVVVYLDTFLELVKAANSSPDMGKMINDAYAATANSKETRYALENLKAAIARALRVLE